ncbi:porin [Roseateles oligotrophus]|uniref:Porin n=1 Tax=Roseateles oligotrophus TaxID=1769250 RepID=A0ABT2YME4_9BURK|nr:porin [Roseateles oligotrophus]MCV2371242.1 porin [Roseateles oligotrophus]
MLKQGLTLAFMFFVGGLAQAQSAVTVYGVLDMAINHENNGAGGPGTKTTIDSGVQSGSRLGFKGSENIGGGLSVIFQLEMGLNADTGKAAQGGLAFGRGVWVGLEGGFGALRLGRQNKPLHTAVDSVDPFRTSIIGGTAGESTSASGLGRPFYVTNPRTDNTINYISSNVGGLVGTVAYTFGEQTGSAGKMSQLGLSASYTKGPFYAVLAYNGEKDLLLNQLEYYFIGGAYDFGLAKIAAAYGSVTANDNFLPNGKTDLTMSMIGLTIPTGSGDVIASVTGVDNGLAEGRGRQFGVGYTYYLSKRTNFYTSLARVANESNSNAGKLAYKVGATERLLNFGVRHLF